MELVISIVIGILIVEVYAWLPKISQWLVERAVKQVRGEDRIRCREEWNAALDALPNTIAKLVHAVSFVGAAHRINADFFEAKLTEIDDVIGDLGRKHSGMGAFYLAAKESLAGQREEVRRRLDQQLIETKAQIDEISKQRPALLFQNLVVSLEKFVRAYVDATGQAADLLIICLDSAIVRLEHVHNLIAEASKKRDQVSGLLVSRSVSPDRLAALLTDLAGDLHVVKSIFEDDKWGDDEALLRHQEIMAALRNARHPGTVSFKN